MNEYIRSPVLHFLLFLVNRRNVASFSLICMIYFGKCLSKLDELFSCCYFCSICYSDMLHGISVNCNIRMSTPNRISFPVFIHLNL